MLEATLSFMGVGVPLTEPFIGMMIAIGKNYIYAGRVDDFIEDLEALVNIDSSSDNLAGIQAVAEFFIPRLEAIGFATRLEKLGDRGVPCQKAQNRTSTDSTDRFRVSGPR